MGITVSYEQEGPGSSESRRLKQSARARRALNAAVCRKLQCFLTGDLQNAADANAKRLRFSQQRQLDREGDESSVKDEEEVECGRVDDDDGDKSESDEDFESDDDEDGAVSDEEVLEELEESLVELLARLPRESVCDRVHASNTMDKVAAGTIEQSEELKGGSVGGLVNNNNNNGGDIYPEEEQEHIARLRLGCGMEEDEKGDKESWTENGEEGEGKVRRNHWKELIQVHFQQTAWIMVVDVVCSRTEPGLVLM